MGGDAKSRSLEPVGVGATSRGTPNSPKGTLTGQSMPGSPEGAKVSSHHQRSSRATTVKEKDGTRSPTLKMGPMKASHDILTLDKPDDAHLKNKTQKSADSDAGSREVTNIRSGKVRHRTNSPARNKLVTVDMASGEHKSASPEPRLLPTPPPSARSDQPRPSSAQRFRHMVMQFRETS